MTATIQTLRSVQAIPGVPSGYIHTKDCRFFMRKDVRLRLSSVSPHLRDSLLPVRPGP